MAESQVFYPAGMAGPTVADMQEALRTLWPDRPVVYFTESAAEAADKGPGTLLTHEEQLLLGRVSRTIAAVRAEGVDDFLQWLADQGLAADLPRPLGQLVDQWKADRRRG